MIRSAQAEVFKNSVWVWAPKFNQSNINPGWDAHVMVSGYTVDEFTLLARDIRMNDVRRINPMHAYCAHVGSPLLIIHVYKKVGDGDRSVFTQSSIFFRDPQIDWVL